jgi:TonB family protein
LFPGVPVAGPTAPAKLPVAAGSFDAIPAEAQRRTAPTADIRASGFGTTGPTSPSRPRAPSVVASGAFAGVAAAIPAPEPAAKPKPSPTAFATAETSPPHQPGTARQPTSEPLEILYKPRPAYTAEARRAHIEGDIILEVLFTGSGTLRVLRTVRGLGYGLEQNAIDAASKIRFRPAREDGHPVDTVATVRITFQIAD